jgi:Helicase HerA, central domain
VYDLVRDTLSFLPALDESSGEKLNGDKKQGRSFWDRALGRYPDGREQAQEDDQTEEWDEQWYDDDDDCMLFMDSSMFTFSQLLDAGFKPSLRKIFLGRLADGTDVFVEAKDLCHVALAGNTGNGKTSLMRLIMAQLCYVRVSVVLLNPHYMLYEHDSGEDWTPFTPYLARNPLDYVTPDAIAFMLKWVIEKTLARRMELGRTGKSVGKPYFIVIDELPAIVAERKEVAGYIAKLLREGRKYGIFLIVASTDFQVKTIGMDERGGGVRKNFRTACYVGGDSTTANVLLEKQSTPIPETDLGKGTMMLRCSATSKAVLATVPYCDNDALYRLLGPSTFVLENNSPSLDMPRSERENAPVSMVNVNTENAVNELEKLVNAPG